MPHRPSSRSEILLASVRKVGDLPSPRRIGQCQGSHSKEQSPARCGSEGLPTAVEEAVSLKQRITWLTRTVDIGHVSVPGSACGVSAGGPQSARSVDFQLPCRNVDRHSQREKGYAEEKEYQSSKSQRMNDIT